MDKNIAKNLMAEIALLDEALNRNAHLIESIKDEFERKEFRHAIATIIGEVYIQLIIPIVKQYPDLDPDQDKNSNPNIPSTNLSNKNDQ